LLVLQWLPSSCFAQNVPATFNSGTAPLRRRADLRLAPGLGRRSLGILAVGGIAAAISWETENVGASAHALDGWPADGVTDVGDWYGNGVTLGVGTLGLLCAGRLSGNARLTATGVDLTRSLLSTAAAVWVLKAGIGRRRPNGGRYSFPSGHTAAAFAVAPVLQRHFGWGVGTAAYTMAILTAAGRVEEQRHYPSDVFFGAAIGMAAGYWAISYHRGFGVLDHLMFGKGGVGMEFDF